ncbi:MAG TPA: hypothetical protein VF310_17455 [Vicinamibacteria bacterium]
MTALSLFDWLADGLEQGSALSRLEARGILRLTLQKAGHDPKELTEAQALHLLQAALPEDLEGRGIAQAAELCRRLRADLAALTTGAAPAPAAVPAAAPAPMSIFDWVSHAVEAETSLSRLEARGALRLALKDAGLVPERATRREVEVVLKAVAPKHLHACSVRDAEAVCGRILAALRTAAVVEDTAGGDSPEDVFRRFGR